MSNAPDSAPPTVATDEPDHFEHVLVEHPDGSDECAFVPPAGAPESEETVWIRATGSAFVARDDVR